MLLITRCRQPTDRGCWPRRRGGSIETQGPDSGGTAVVGHTACVEKFLGPQAIKSHLNLR